MKLKIAFILLFLSSSVFSESAHENEAERLLDISGTKAAMETMADMMLSQQLQQNPTLSPYENVMRSFFKKYLGYEKIKPFYISLYVETFTMEELKEINAFYSTATGKKSIDTMPSLMVRGGEYATIILQENIEELQQNIAKEAERLKTLANE